MQFLYESQIGNLICCSHLLARKINEDQTDWYLRIGPTKWRNMGSEIRLSEGKTNVLHTGIPQSRVKGLTVHCPWHDRWKRGHQNWSGTAFLLQTCFYSMFSCVSQVKDLMLILLYLYLYHSILKSFLWPLFNTTNLDLDFLVTEFENKQL